MIDESNTYFFEDTNTIFQVLAPCYDSITHTFPLDIQSPDSSDSAEQKQWYAMNQRAKALTTYIMDLYVRYKQLRSLEDVTPSSILDKMRKLKILCYEWMNVLKYEKKFISNNEELKMLDELIDMLKKPSKRENSDEINFLFQELNEFNLMDKDRNNLEEIILTLHYIEKKIPDLKTKTNTEHFNEIKVILSIMIGFYKKHSLELAEERKEYSELFSLSCQAEQETNILNELDILNDVIKNFISISGKYKYDPYLNRLMSPQEILSQTEPEDNNEINLDTYTKEPLKVKAWLLSKSIFQTKSEKTQEILKRIFVIAEREDIPVLVRTALPNYFVKEKAKKMKLMTNGLL